MIADAKKYVKNKGTWDYNLEYNATYKKFLHEIKLLRKKFEEGNISTNKVKAFSNLIIGLTQLRNGSRVGEAIAAANNFISDLSIKVTEVLIQKRDDNRYRKIILPEEIKPNDLEYIKPYLEFRQGNKKNLVVSLSRFFQEHFGFSTHALRYSWISYMAFKKVAPQVIATVTGHKTLDMLIGYTNKKLGENILFNMFRRTAPG